MSEPITDVEPTKRRHATGCSSRSANRGIGSIGTGHCRADLQRAELLQTTVLTNGCRTNSELAAAVAKRMRAGCQAGSPLHPRYRPVCDRRANQIHGGRALNTAAAELVGDLSGISETGAHMWLVVVRESRPDVPFWPGRRVLAVVDAAAWPLAWVLLAKQAPAPVGIVGPFVIAVAALSAAMRLYRAIWINHRYWFTTWRWARIIGALLLMSEVLKLALPS
ncbi:MAG: hypothetical protein ABIR54_06240 [Burkholderiaceae bacterium]